jgi:5'-methylthioadenosine/S-adenosylhomocysteine nucleosidase
VSLLISTGLAGGLAKLPKLSVLIADGVVQHDFDTTAFGRQKGHITGFDGPIFKTSKKETNILRSGIKNASSGIIATGDQFINSEEKRREIVAEFGAVACDMESGAVAQIASLEGIPCCIARVISDDAGDGAEDDFNTFINEASTLNANLILGTIDKL